MTRICLKVMQRFKLIQLVVLSDPITRENVICNTVGTCKLFACMPYFYPLCILLPLFLESQNRTFYAHWQSCCILIVARTCCSDSCSFPSLMTITRSRFLSSFAPFALFGSIPVLWHHTCFSVSAVCEFPPAVNQLLDKDSGVTTDCPLFFATAQREKKKWNEKWMALPVTLVFLCFQHISASRIYSIYPMYIVFLRML